MVGFYNMPVVHETHGEGKITAWDGRTITVHFKDVEKRYWFPIAFTDKVLKAANEKDKVLIQEITDRWTESVIIRGTMGLKEQSSDEEIQGAIEQLCYAFQKAYHQEELTEIITKALSERLNTEYSKELVAKRVAQVLAEIEERITQALEEQDGELAEDDTPTDASSKPAKKKLKFTKESDFTGGMFAYFGIQLLTVLATACSLGIAYPFMTCWRLRWEAEHTIIDGQKLTFDGNGGQLFGKYIIWWLLSIVTFGVYGLIWMPLHLNRWITKHTHFEGATKATSEFDGNIWQYLGVRIVARLVTGATLGFGTFWAHCYLERWQAKHTTYDGYRLQFDGTGMQYFGKCIVWVLLTVVTFGIYSFWLTIKSKKWTISHTHVA